MSRYAGFSEKCILAINYCMIIQNEVMVNFC